MVGWPFFIFQSLFSWILHKRTHTFHCCHLCVISVPAPRFYRILSKLKLTSSTLKKLPAVTHPPLFAWTSHPPHVNDQEMVFLTILCPSNFGSGSQKRHTASGFQAWETSGKSVLRRSGGLSGCLRWLCHKTQKLRGAACRVWSAERVEEAKDVDRDGGHRKRTLRHFKRRPRPGVHRHWVWKRTLSVRLLTNIFFFTLWSFFFHCNLFSDLPLFSNKSSKFPNIPCCANEPKTSHYFSGVNI